MTSSAAEPARSGWQRLVEYFDAQDWATRTVPPGNGLDWAYRGTNGEWYGQAWWFDETEQLVVYSVVPLPIPAEACGAVAGVAHRINSELAYGCLEWDETTAQVRFRTALAVDARELTESMIDRVVRGNVAALDHYLPAVVRAASGIEG